jgi:hypothetical protein
LLVALCVVGCAKDVTGPTQAAHGVILSANVGASTSSGTSVDIVFTNSGSAPAYLDICPGLIVEQLINMQWVRVGPLVSCVATPVPDLLSGGGSVRVTSTPLAMGQYHFSRKAGARQDLSDAILLTSLTLALP